MGFIIPKINTVSTDIKDVSVYLRSVKKWGKSTLFRDVVLTKYNDLTRGVLVECGLEHGDSMLNSNMVHLDTYKEFAEFKKWLIDSKGKEHNIEMVCFDTADEMMPIFEKEIVRQYNAENPTKQVKTIKAAYGGYNAGIEMVASLIKKYMGEIKQAGFGVWVIAHSKFKQIREKGGLEEEGYMQLTSNLINAYESAFGDIFDCTLTGVIDRVFEEKTTGEKVKKYTTDSIRKLYFRGTTLIDAGGRFAMDSVPEYLEYDCSSLEFAKRFIDTIENGLKNSVIDISKTKTPITTTSTAKVETPIIEETPIDTDENPIEETTETVDKTALMDDIRTRFKSAGKETKAQVKAILTEKGSGKLDDSLSIDVLNEISSILDDEV